MEPATQPQASSSAPANQNAYMSCRQESMAATLVLDVDGCHMSRSKRLNGYMVSYFIYIYLL